MVLDGKSSQEYPTNAYFIKVPFFVLHLFYYTLMIFLMMLYVMIRYYTIYADDTTFYSKCDQASDLWQQLEFVSEPESDL